ncbi:MAG: hypothetical protein AAFQ62_15610 [Pseudomonadota bacterium]
MRRRRSRRLQDSLSIDASLRRSRVVYTALSILFVPLGLLNAVFLFQAIGLFVEDKAVLSVYALMVTVWYTIIMLLPISFVRSLMECNRRLRILREDPEARVKRMPVSFLETVFLIFRVT